MKQFCDNVTGQFIIVDVSLMVNHVGNMEALIEA
jgi:hypothetical protein